jgi:hypothetical protein
MTDERTRLEARLADVRQALAEARSHDVRDFLRELLETYEARLADGDGGSPDGTLTPTAGP